MGELEAGIVEPPPLAHLEGEEPADAVMIKEVGEIRSGLESRRSVFETFARRGDFAISFAQSTAFDHETDTVMIGVEQLYNLGVRSPREFDFSVCHELGHMKELYDDPEGYAKVIKEGERDDGLGGVYFRLYNCLMDIYVNRNNARTFDVFRRRGGSSFDFSDEVKAVYRDKLFRTRDFSNGPLCVQFTDYLLQVGMGVGEDVKLSPEVQAAIDEGITDLGQHYDYKSFIDQFLVPVEDRGSSWQATISQRKNKIDRCIRPVFERLLKIDSERNNKLPERKSDGISDKELRDALDSAKKKKAEREMTPEQKAKAEKDRQAAEMAKENGLNKEQTQKFMELYEKMQPVIAQLTEFWRQLRTQITDWEKRRQGYFKTGSDLSIPEVIRKFPTIMQKPDQVPVMERDLYEETIEYRPRNFKLTIVPDLSGSMSGDIEKVQSLAIALAASLSTINSEAKINGDPDAMACSLDVIGYSNSVIPIVENKREITLSDIMKTYSKITTVGGTSSHTAFSHIKNKITQDDVAAMANGDQINILIEITDGDTNDPNESLRNIRAIEAAGYHTGAIKFGYGVRLDKASDKPEDDAKAEHEAMERDTFDQMWNQGGRRKGIRINKPDEVTSAIYRILQKLIDEQLRQ